MEDCHQANQIAKEIQNKNGRRSANTINRFLSILKKSNKGYTELSYIGDGSFALVLKAKNRQNEEIAIKVIEYQDTLSAIASAKREYTLLQNLTNSDYIVKIHDQFDLADIENDSEKTTNQKNRFFVQEQELCCGNLKELLRKFRANQTNPSDSFKETLAIQMLDGLNLLHSRGIIHRDIRSSNFLVSSNENYPIILKLCDIGLTSPQRIHELRKNTIPFQEQGHENYMAPEVIGINGKYSIESDLFSLGIVLLELDNVLTLDYSKVTFEEYNQLQEGRIFENISLNRQSFLYSIASAFLNKSCKDRGSAHSMLLALIHRSNDNKKIPIFSIILDNQIKSINYDFFFSKIKKQMEQNEQQTLKDNVDNKAISAITSQRNQQNSPFNNQLTTELIKSALRMIFAQGDYGVDLELLHISLHSIIFGATNIKTNKKCALKLSLCHHKPDVIRKIGIMRICQTPYILRLYNFRFFQDTQNNEFILYEFERSNYTLSHYLSQQQIDGEYSSQLKEQIMLQIIDNVNFLHKNEIVHGNISLNSFQVSENEQGGVEVKLADFDSADMVLSHLEFDEEQLDRDRFFVPPYNSIKSKNAMISREELFDSPEKQLNNGQFSTKKSDCFSLGLCLVILDNYISFQDQQLHPTCMSTSFNQCNFLDQFLEDKCLINKNTKIYQQAQEYLQFSTKQRKPLSICIQDNSTLCTLYSAISEFGFQLPLKQQICLDLKNINNFENTNTLDQLTSMTTLLSLSLDLENNHTGDIEAKYILSPLSNLTNLTNLHLNLQNNGIGDIGAKDLLIPLRNLTNISYLKVNLKCNQIGQIGAQSLLLPLANLANLSFLSLNLQDNQITDTGAAFLLSPLKDLMFLSTLSLNLWNNEIKPNENIQQLLAPLSNLHNLQVLSLNLYDNNLSDIGSEYILAPITRLIHLQTLTLDLWSNQIGQTGAETLLQPILHLKYLQNLSLDLWSNSIGDNGAKCLLSPLINSLNLSTLSINLINNQITEAGAIHLLSPLQNHLNLSIIFLDLNCNQIGDIGAKSLLSSFTNLINLSNLQLNLQNNNIGDIGGRYLLSYLTNLVNLQHFSMNLYKNNIGDIGATFLLASFEKLINLQSVSLILGRNVIAVQGAKSLLLPLQNLKNIQNLSLNLMHNLIQTEGANALLYPLSNIQSLQSVSLELKSPGLQGLERNKLKEQIKHVQSVTINF